MLLRNIQCPVILMHNRSNPASVEVRTQLGNAYIGAEYEDLIEDVKRELLDSVNLAREAGVSDDRIILDPGIGFGKKVAHNLELINRLDEIRRLGFPVLLGPSRKSFIGYTLDLPPDQRLEGTAAAVAIGIARGADIVRVHDVEYMARVAKMTDAIVRKGKMTVNYSQVLFDDGIADDYGKELLRNGIIEAKAGNKDSAHRYFDRATYMSSDHQVMAEAWFWMSQVTDNPAEKRQALENCLSNDLGHARARRALAILDGKIKPDEIINPDAVPAAPAHLSQADAQRFMCPKCGGRMNFAPDGQSLVCEYCSRNQALHTQASRQSRRISSLPWQPRADMISRWRNRSFNARDAAHNSSCPQDQLSAVCVYCGSPHVINLEKSKDLIAPDGIIPFAFDQKHAVQLLIRWVEGNQIKPEKQVEPPRGLYLPLWTFDLGGVIDYTGEMVDQEDIGFNIGLGQRQPKVIHVNDSYPLLIHDCSDPGQPKIIGAVRAADPNL
jgi:hypothetical protein